MQAFHFFCLLLQDGGVLCHENGWRKEGNLASSFVHVWAICWISFYAYRQLDFYAFKSEIPFQHLNVCKWKFILTLFFLSLLEHFNFLAYYIRDDCLRFKIITGGSFLSSTLCCCHLKWRKCERLSVWEVIKIKLRLM